MRLHRLRFFLRIVDGTPVALVKAGDNHPEMLGTRYDLFRYEGGISWGYKGSGVQNLAHAIAAKYSELETSDPDTIVKRAYAIVENLLSRLNGGQEHEISDDDIARAIAEG